MINWLSWVSQIASPKGIPNPGIKAIRYCKNHIKFAFSDENRLEIYDSSLHETSTSTLCSPKTCFDHQRQELSEKPSNLSSHHTRSISFRESLIKLYLFIPNSYFILTRPGFPIRRMCQLNRCSRILHKVAPLFFLHFVKQNEASSVDLV
jgi:hypothetical protein